MGRSVGATILDSVGRRRRTVMITPSDLRHLQPPLLPPIHSPAPPPPPAPRGLLPVIDRSMMMTTTIMITTTSWRRWKRRRRRRRRRRRCVGVRSLPRRTGSPWRPFERRRSSRTIAIITQSGKPPSSKTTPPRGGTTTPRRRPGLIGRWSIPEGIGSTPTEPGLRPSTPPTDSISSTPLRKRISFEETPAQRETPPDTPGTSSDAAPIHFSTTLTPGRNPAPVGVPLRPGSGAFQLDR